jgi:hypothetical protein
MFDEDGNSRARARVRKLRNVRHFGLGNFMTQTSGKVLRELQGKQTETNAGTILFGDYIKASNKLCVRSTKKLFIRRKDQS